MALSSAAMMSSHRGVKLHTFRPDEDRGYTSTPTKIGGHCLDHVRVGLTVWGRHSPDGGKPSNAAALFDSEGRFGGLCTGNVVLNLTRPARRACVGSSNMSSFRRSLLRPPPPPPQPQLRGPRAVFPLFSAPVDLPPDTVAWQRQEEHAPHWHFEEEDQGRVDLLCKMIPQAAAPQQQADNSSSGATRHAGALMAVLLSKLANNNGSGSNNGDDGVHEVLLTTEEEETSEISTLRNSSVVEELLPRPTALRSSSHEAASLMESSTNCFAENISVAGRGNIILSKVAAVANESWAWKSRIQQAPSHSKLRRYTFVRRLGAGSHGTILLVRKKSSGKLRVIKESSFLPEAVNEARLLLLAAGMTTAGKESPTTQPDGGGSAGGTQLKAMQTEGSHRSSERKNVALPDASGLGSGTAWLRQNERGSDGAVSGNAKQVKQENGLGVTTGRGGGIGERYERGGVVQLHDFFVETLGHTSFAYLELEYCDGGDLHDLILNGGGGGGARLSDDEAIDRRHLSQPTAVECSHSAGARAGDGGIGREARGLPVEQIAKVALGLCEGLQFLHERGVLHRDLKPGNVLMTKAGAVRIADLGVSTSLQPSRPLTEHAAGTIPFMAPEVRRFLLGFKVQYSGKADVWAIGALLYAMAIGDTAPAELATATRAELVSVVGHRTGSEVLSMLTHKTLDPDPARRPSAHQIASMLEEFCRQQGWPLMKRTESRRSGAPSATPTLHAPAAGFARL